jgi:hypothetical protein
MIMEACGYDGHGMRKKLSRFVNTTWTRRVSFSYFPLRKKPRPGHRETLQDFVTETVDFIFGSKPKDSRNAGKVIDIIFEM